jgi:hypothetical protein
LTLDSLFQLGGYPRPAEVLALTASPFHACADTLLDDRALELGEDTKHLKHGLAPRRGGVDALLMQEEVDANGVDFRQEADEVLKATTDYGESTFALLPPRRRRSLPKT